jgi:hypothetical protein
MCIIIEGRLMLFYVACWTEIEGIYSCGHEHVTIREALECLVPDGKSFIRARENGRVRSLNEEEFCVFQFEVKGGILKGRG